MVIMMQKNFKPPAWVKDAIFYQIFVDRFYNGDKQSDPPETEKWGEKPARRNFFGGDLKGIIEKLPYLKELGITAIYLTPIFESESNHKYDTIDYMKVDGHFGDLGTLKELVRMAHDLGIKIILDGVFNHCGYKFWAFQDVIKNQQNSKYVDWFVIHKFPILGEMVESAQRTPPPYEAWNNLWWLPKFNHKNPEVREYLFGVAEYWMREAGIDGWRLDVASEVPHDFWVEFRKRVKEINPDAYLLAEIGGDASPWLEGDEFDGAMNYQLLRGAMIEFFVEGKVDVETFDRRLAEMRRKYPPEAHKAMYNLLGSHDTPRYLTVCRGDVKRMKLSMIFQMTYIGAPAIYYGDEVGMVGEGDPYCRRTMVWETEKWNRELFDFYGRLIGVRKKYSALRTGSFETLLADNDRKLFAYKREDEKSAVIVILNNDLSDHEVEVNVSEKEVFEDVLNDRKYEPRDGRLLVLVEKTSGAILIKPHN